MASTTTAAPGSTTLPAETSSVMPDTTVETLSGPIEEPSTTAVTTEKPVEHIEATPIRQLWDKAQASGHPEIWGVILADPQGHVPTQIVLQKYLNANEGDLTRAEKQLTDTLEWRAKTKPLDLLHQKYSKAKFEGLGYATVYGSAEDSAEPEQKEVFTWNVYGKVRSFEETFGDQEEFLNWRVALMEVALQQLDLPRATKPITAEYDPYKIFQVHDYKSISFFSSPPQVKSASKETIRIFATNYPELLKEKFFVNVPSVMGFVYTFMKLFVAAKTIKKFHPMSNGLGLAQEFGASKVTGLGAMLPEEYGGKGKSLDIVGKEPELT